ncbi:decapping and exoribonuclease protein-like [Ctenocephalides felis]|uniref:decapping and exoribonuclease protein-like n=1 Tax=Ctenocephalides felis TaxID=7515 RepID=UPI000E6E2B70|nr:decapping and exoribonuclease protein-like [Ctenocephalides felis]
MNEDIYPSDFKNSQQVFPKFSRPSVIGHFSVDADRNVAHDLSQLKFLHMPACMTNIGFNLNNGINQTVHKDEKAHEEKLDHLLKFIVYNRKQLCSPAATTNLINFDIVCFRGLLTKLMCTPFENREGWNILAQNWKGTTYLCAWESEKSKMKRLKDIKYQRKFMSWGYKFEQFLLSSSPQRKPDITIPVIESEEFCCVFKSKLDDLRLFYGAEMDGINTTNLYFNFKDLDKAQFVELKTNRIITTENQSRNFKKIKSMKWWCQSFLVGIDEILCGCRDDNGILLEIKPYKVKDIPKNNDNFWSATDCMNFCKEVLYFMQKIARTHQNQTILFSWNPGDKITYEIDNDKNFLPTWYLETMSKEDDII